MVPFKFNTINYLSIPANAATDEALDLSTKPGPEGMLAPGNNPALLLINCERYFSSIN